MKICMLAPEFLPVWGGVGTYIVGLVRHLPKDMEIHVVTPIREGVGKEKLSTLEYDFSRYFGKNIKIHLTSKVADTFFYNAKFQYDCFNYVPKLVKEEKIDLIHSHTAHMSDLLLMLRRLNIPTVTTIHTTIRSQRAGTKLSHHNIRDSERTEKATYFMYTPLRIAEELYFTQKRPYITPSNWMSRWLQKNSHINGNIRVIPNAIDINDYTSTKINAKESGFLSKEFKDKKIVLYVGRLLSMKGIDTFINAIPSIIKKAKSNDFLFVFAGPGRKSPYIQKLREMKVNSYCLFTGPLGRESTIQMMRAAEMVVVPSYLENCPYVILESMACGTPVVASNVGGIPEIIENNYNGLLVAPGSSEALANAISILLTDKSLRNLMSQRAKEKIATTFSWDVNIPKYLKIYSEAISN